MLPTEAKEFVIERLIHSPREKVWDTWTRPSHLKNWWGPKGFSCPVARVDLRVGGSYLYAMRGPDGKDYWSGGVYKEIVQHERIVVTDMFMDAKGNKMRPSYYGLSPDFPDESEVTVTFESHHDKTKLSIIYKLPDSHAARMALEDSGMEAGWNSSLDKFDAEAKR